MAKPFSMSPLHRVHTGPKDPRLVKGRGAYIVLRSKQFGSTFVTVNTGTYEGGWYEQLGLATDSLQEAQRRAGVPEWALAKEEDAGEDNPKKV